MSRYSSDDEIVTVYDEEKWHEVYEDAVYKNVRPRQPILTQIVSSASCQIAFRNITRKTKIYDIKKMSNNLNLKTNYTNSKIFPQFLLFLKKVKVLDKNCGKLNFSYGIKYYMSLRFIVFCQEYC